VGGANLNDFCRRDRWRANAKIREIAILIFRLFFNKWAENIIFREKCHP